MITIKINAKNLHKYITFIDWIKYYISLINSSIAYYKAFEESIWLTYLLCSKF